MAEKSKADKAKDQADKAADAAPSEEPLPGSLGVVDPNATADAVARTQDEKDPSEGEEDEAERPAPLPKARRGHRYLQYNGGADVLEHGDIKFRPGEWVEVPKDIAEELLTFPFEEFKAMEAEGDDG